MNKYEMDTLKGCRVCRILLREYPKYVEEILKFHHDISTINLLPKKMRGLAEKLNLMFDKDDKIKLEKIWKDGLKEQVIFT